MKTVQDYEIPQDSLAFDLEMPAGFKVLGVQQHLGCTIMYVAEDAEAPTNMEKFVAIHTDEMRQEIESGYYVGSYQVQSGALVYHLFHIPRE